MHGLCMAIVQPTLPAVLLDVCRADCTHASATALALQSMLVVCPPTSQTCQSAIAKYDVWLTTCDQSPSLNAKLLPSNHSSGVAAHLCMAAPLSSQVY